MSPRYPTTNSNPYHKCQTIAHTNVEEPPKELITPGTITQHYLPHCTVSQQHQGEGSQALSQELPHIPNMLTLSKVYTNTIITV